MWSSVLKVRMVPHVGRFGGGLLKYEEPYMAKHMAQMRRGLNSTLARVVLLGLVCQGLILVAISFTQAQVVPPKVNDWFKYTVKETVRDGSGFFEDYTEDTTTTGTYTFTAVTSTNFTVYADYSWQWTAIQYPYNGEGSAKRSVTINLTNLHYAQAQTDLVGYDGVNGKNLAVWFLVPANLILGQTVQILDETFTVTNEQMTVWSNGLPRLGLELKHSGPTILHNYADENWTAATSTDFYYVDRETGFVFAERLELRTDAINYWSSEYYRNYPETSFTWTTQYDITASSFDIKFDNVALTGLIVGIVAAIVLPLLGIYALYRYMHWKPRTESFRNLGQIRIALVKNIENFPQHLENRATDLFAAFLVDFATKTLLARGKVAVAVDTAKSELIGVAYYNKEEGVGSIYSKNTEITDALRQFVKCKDFFSDIRHEIPADLLENMRKFDNPNIQPQAFNVFETYQILKLAPIQHADYDTNFISYMQEKDLADVSKVAEQVYGRGGKKTFRALLESGDIGFVARVKGQVVGFAFASFVNQVGRNHTLSVLPKFRNQGIGRELTRARLATLANLGAQEVITEIADWNLPSLQVSNSLGFKKVGVMFVETARSIKIKKTIVRW